MDRFASSIIKVTYEGPDVHEQSLFQTFRVSLLFSVLPLSLLFNNSHSVEFVTSLRPDLFLLEFRARQQSSTTD